MACAQNASVARRLARCRARARTLNHCRSRSTSEISEIGASQSKQYVLVQVRAGAAPRIAIPRLARPPRSPATTRQDHRGTIPHLHSVGPDAYPNWDAIYLDNVERLYRMMYARVGNRADAEDLTAEVFQAALKPLRSSASVGEVRAYLLATARTVLASHWRRHYGTEITTIDVGADRAVSRRAAGRVGRARTGFESCWPSYPIVTLVSSSCASSTRARSERRLTRMNISVGNAKVLQHRALRRAAQVDRRASMSTRRLAAFVESLRRNRRPKPFTPDADDVEAMRAAIELNNAKPGADAAAPNSSTTSIVASPTSSTSTDGTVDLTAARLSRRRVLGGIGAAAAAAAAAAVGGAVVDRELLNPGSSPSVRESAGAGSRRGRLATGPRRRRTSATVRSPVSPPRRPSASS